MAKIIRWSINDLVRVINARRNNEFDANLVVSGDRGNGKSTLIGKLMYRLKGFRPWKHQEYSLEKVKDLLKTQRKGLCWDDEGINTAYKRNWQDKGQQELIKILTNYRDRFNVYACAIPNFFSLDKDLRHLFFIHLQVIKRGVAVVHMPVQGRLYSADRWDTPYNKKTEEKWAKRFEKNPNFKPQFQRLTTFRGFLYFGDMTEKQKKLYKEIKWKKRGEEYGEEQNSEKEKSFYEKLYDKLVDGELTKETFTLSVDLAGYKYTAARERLNRMLKDNSVGKTVQNLLRKQVKPPKGGSNLRQSKVKSQITNIIPDF